MLTKNCKQCETSFQTRESKTVFCGKSCAAKHNNAGRNRWVNKPYDKCPQCSEDVKNRANKYCSRECAHVTSTIARYGTYNKTKKVNGKRVLEEKPCIHCSNMFIPSTPKVIYCSLSCQANKNRQAKIDAWFKDPSTGTVKGRGISRTIRQYLLEQAGFKCSMPDCGWGKVNPVTGNVPLEIEHIDGDCTNNRPDNLIVMCPNCHSLTPTYRALNKGNSTRNRK